MNVLSQLAMREAEVEALRRRVAELEAALAATLGQPVEVS